MTNLYQTYFNSPDRRVDETWSLTRAEAVTAARTMYREVHDDDSRVRGEAVVIRFKVRTLTPVMLVSAAQGKLSDYLSEFVCGEMIWTTAKVSV